MFKEHKINNESIEKSSCGVHSECDISDEALEEMIRQFEEEESNRYDYPEQF